MSKGTPYLYFPGKEALFIALYEEWDCGLAARVGALADSARRSPRRILAAVASAVAAHVTGNPQACRVLMEATTLAAYEPAIAAKVQAANAVSLDQLSGLFAAGVAAGEWPAGTDPAVQARLFAVGLYGLMAHRMSSASGPPRFSAPGTATAGWPGTSSTSGSPRSTRRRPARTCVA